MTFQTTNEEIQQLCSYITSDVSIAQYFGISAARVAKARSEIPASKGFDRMKLRADAEPANDRRTDNMAKSDAYHGSQALERAVRSLAEREAERLRLNDAEHALWLLQDRPSIADIQARAA